MHALALIGAGREIKWPDGTERKHPFLLNRASRWGKPGEPKKARYTIARKKILLILARIRLKLAFFYQKTLISI